MSEYTASLRVAVLGDLQVHRGPSIVDVGPTKQRAVFATLALRSGEAVSMESLLEAVWGAEPPMSGRQLVHTYIARLRHALEPEMPPRGRNRVIGSTSLGYRLLIDSEMVDIVRFKLLHTQARRYLAVGESARAFNRLGEAMRLWRDPTLTEMSGLLRISDALDGLRRTWREAALDFVTVGIELRAAPEILKVAQQLAGAEPMHEGVQARYVAALEQTGQRAAAIEHFNNVRVMLSDELGVVPGPRLSGVYRQVLQGTEPPRGQRPAVTGLPTPTRPPWHGPGPGLGQLIHRDDDLDAVARILGEHRLLSVAGPPGCGKSALALTAAARLRDEYLGGVAVLECSRYADATEVRRGLTMLLGGPAGLDDPVKLLGDQQVLLLLDNLEHLVDDCAPMVDDLVRACRHVSVLVTSREPLGLPYETVWRVPTLTVSAADEPTWTGDRPAVKLFVRRAAQVCPDFRLGRDNAETVAMICHRLDDLPLAIELAAACLATDTLDELVRRLDRSLHEINPPRRATPAHQRSLWMALRRSVECLSEYERWCFLRLGRLPSSFEPAVVAQAWAGAPRGPVDTGSMLARLVDKSLLFVQHDPAGPRYYMLRLMHRFAAELGAAELGTAELGAAGLGTAGLA